MFILHYITVYAEQLSRLIVILMEIPILALLAIYRKFSTNSSGKKLTNELCNPLYRPPHSSLSPPTALSGRSSVFVFSTRCYFGRFPIGFRISAMRRRIAHAHFGFSSAQSLFSARHLKK